MAIYGYARVSTLGQDLEAQIKTLKENGAKNEHIYQEKFTGTKKDRPEFAKLLAKLQSGDTLVVTKLDRFARSTVDAITTVKELFARGVKINVLNMGMIEDTVTGRLILTIFSGFAEFERDMIIERTQEGKALAKKKNGFSEGRPKEYTAKKLDHAMELLKENSYTEVAEMTGISRSTLLREGRKRRMDLLVSVTRNDGEYELHALPGIFYDDRGNIEEIASGYSDLRIGKYTTLKEATEHRVRFADNVQAAHEQGFVIVEEAGSLIGGRLVRESDGFSIPVTEALQQLQKDFKQLLE